MSYTKNIHKEYYYVKTHPNLKIRRSRPCLSPKILTLDLRNINLIREKILTLKNRVKIELIKKTVTESIESKNSETHYLKTS